MQIRDSLTVVGGGSAGIGLGAAKALAARGARIVLLGRRGERLEAALDVLRELHPGVQASALSADLRNQREVERVAGRIRKDHGVPDLLVYCAGAGRLLSIEEEDAENFRTHLETSCLAPFLLTRAFIEDMLARNAPARIVLGGGSPIIRLPFPAIGYITSRSGLRGFARSLAEDLHDTRIGVTYCEPGGVSEGSAYFTDNAGARERLPFRRFQADFLYSTADAIGERIVRAAERNRSFWSPAWVRILGWMAERAALRPLFRRAVRAGALDYEDGGPLSGNRRRLNAAGGPA